MATIESVNQVRYLSGAGQVTTAYAITLPASGQYASKAALEAVNANLKIFWLGSVGDESGGKRLRGARFIPFGTGANNDSFVMRIYAVHLLGGSGNGQAGPIELKLLATVTCTHGNALGIASGMFSDSERIVDTISISKSAYLTALEAQLGLSNGAGAYSPADDTQACFWIPDFGNAAGFVIDTDLGSGTAANFLIQLDV